MKVNINNNIKQFNKNLSKFSKIDIPNISRITINETANKVRDLNKTAMGKHLDRPTKSTLRSLYVIYSKKTKLQAIVRFRDWAQEYMSYSIFGGIRRVHRTASPHRNSKLNSHGNIPGRKTGLLKKPNTFIAKINGIDGIWQRQKKGLKLLYRVITNPRYEKIYPFFRISSKVVKTFLPLKFKKVSSYYIRKAGYKT